MQRHWAVLPGCTFQIKGNLKRQPLIPAAFGKTLYFLKNTTFFKRIVDNFHSFLKIILKGSGSDGVQNLLSLRFNLACLLFAGFDTYYSDSWYNLDCFIFSNSL